MSGRMGVDSEAVGSHESPGIEVLVMVSNAPLRGLRSLAMRVNVP